MWNKKNIAHYIHLYGLQKKKYMCASYRTKLTLKFCSQVGGTTLVLICYITTLLPYDTHIPGTWVGPGSYLFQYYCILWCEQKATTSSNKIPLNLVKQKDNFNQIFCQMSISSLCFTSPKCDQKKKSNELIGPGQVP